MKRYIWLIILLLSVVAVAQTFGGPPRENEGVDPSKATLSGNNAYVGNQTVTGTASVSAGLTASGTVQLLGNAAGGAVKINGDPAVPVTSIDGKGGLDVWNNTLHFGSDTGTNGRTNSVAKLGKLVLAHFDNTQEPVAAITMSSSSNTDSSIYYGGGFAANNAVRNHYWYVGPAGITTTGTLVWKMNNAGELVGSSTGGADYGAYKFQCADPVYFDEILQIGTGTPDATTELQVFGEASVSAGLTASGPVQLLGDGAAVKVVGDPAAPVTSVDGKGNVDVWGNSLLLGSDLSSTTRTNATSKYFYQTFPHYTNTEQPVTMMYGSAGNGVSWVRFGGGGSSANSCTALEFYTAANNTTLIGTQRLRINPAGEIIATSSSSADYGAYQLQCADPVYFDEILQVGTGTMDATTELQVFGQGYVTASMSIGTVTPAAGYDLTVASSTSIGGLLKLVPMAEPPAVPEEGMVYTDTDHHIYYWNGSAWLQLDNAP